MEEAEALRYYWCHMCSRMVNPIMEIEATIKCPICGSGFIEEIPSSAAATPRNQDDDGHNNNNNNNIGSGSLDLEHRVAGGGSSVLSLWAPILLWPPMVFAGADHNNAHRQHSDSGAELVDRGLESVVRGRTRTRTSSSPTILQLGRLQSRHSETDHQNVGRDRERVDDDDDNRAGGERVILINPLNQTMIFQGSYDPSNESHNSSRIPIGWSLGDYFIGPGLDMLLQHLARNDPNRYGTPPALKEAVEALPTVKIEETMQCSVCLDECEIGTEVKEMPCKHKFHPPCILPWLELHSSCPVCRYQLPSDESKLPPTGPERSSGNNNGAGEAGNSNSDNGRRFLVPLPWPFNSLFSSLSFLSSAANSSNSSTSAPASEDGN